MSHPANAELLFGLYAAPRFKFGDGAMCELRGEVVLCGWSSGRIPWPIGRRGRHKSLVLFAGLADAVRRESATAIRHWWGVGSHTVWRWRRALGIRHVNEGSRQLWRDNADTPAVRAGFAKAHSMARDSERCRKISEAQRGRMPPAHVMEAAHRGRRGKPHDAAARRKMSEAQRRRGVWPPAAGVAWSAEEDALALTLPAKEVARRTGRTLTAVYSRRIALGVPDGRKRVKA